MKKDRYGNILKYKARWVVHGYKQKYGLDYEDTFATVVKPMSYKALIALSALRGLKIRQMDVVTAFLLICLDGVDSFDFRPKCLSGSVRDGGAVISAFTMSKSGEVLATMPNRVRHKHPHENSSPC